LDQKKTLLRVGKIASPNADISKMILVHLSHFSIPPSFPTGLISHQMAGPGQQKGLPQAKEQRPGSTARGYGQKMQGLSLPIKDHQGQGSTNSSTPGYFLS